MVEKRSSTTAAFISPPLSCPFLKCHFAVLYFTLSPGWYTLIILSFGNNRSYFIKLFFMNVMYGFFDFLRHFPVVYAVVECGRYFA